MIVLLENGEDLNMKVIESWLQHGPESVPVEDEGNFVRGEILEEERRRFKLLLAITIGFVFIAAIGFYL